MWTGNASCFLCEDFRTVQPSAADWNASRLSHVTLRKSQGLVACCFFRVSMVSLDFMIGPLRRLYPDLKIARLSCTGTHYGRKISCKWPILQRIEPSQPSAQSADAGLVIVAHVGVRA